MTSLSIRSAKSRWMHGIFPAGQLAKGDTSRLEAVAEDAGMDPFYINKYRDLMKYAAGTPPSERFETTHGFYMAVVQGFSASIIMCAVQPFLSWRKSTR